jgi:hypothetical protein
MSPGIRGLPWPEKKIEKIEEMNGSYQRFSNFFQVGATFISQNVLRTALLLSPLEENLSFF